MEALIYVSTAVGLPRPRTIEAILATAHRANPGLGLTGMLLWADTRFAQLLEGPADSLDLMYARLRADPRHEDLVLLSRRGTPRRLFPDWTMGCKRLDRRQNWDLMERLEGASSEDAAGWLLLLMHQVRRGTRQPRRRS